MHLFPPITSNVFKLIYNRRLWPCSPLVIDPLWANREGEGADGYWFWTPKMTRGQQDATIKDSPWFNQAEAYSYLQLKKYSTNQIWCGTSENLYAVQNRSADPLTPRVSLERICLSKLLIAMLESCHHGRRCFIRQPQRCRFAQTAFIWQQHQTLCKPLLSKEVPVVLEIICSLPQEFTTSLPLNKITLTN